MPALSRRLGFLALVFYGIGDVLGAGIYALVGKVIGLAGDGAWLTFLLAAGVAILTGLSYAELSARFPVAGGAAAFVRRTLATGRGSWLATLAGVFVLGSGLVSAATVVSAFGGYLQEVVPFPEALAKFLLVSFLSFLSFWGIHESSRFNIILTIAEVLGLLAVIIVGFRLSGVAELPTWMYRSLEHADVAAVFAGVTIAFYAYIGFEDLSNLAEEAKNPARDLPRAILIAIGVSTLIYLAVTLALQLNVPISEIKESKTPLLLVFEKAGLGGFLKYFSLIAILAITNTGLVNLIMASRLMYGMSAEGLLPAFVGRVHARRSTPWVGVTITYFALLLLVYTGGVKVLAQTTSFLILVVFFLVHLSLLKVKWRKEAHGGITVPPFFPVLGALSCLALMAVFPAEVYARSLIWPTLGFLIWGLQRMRGRPRRRA
jgi:amino acid transporter